MVLESLFSPLKAEKKPFDMFFVGFFYSSIAIFLSLRIFEKLAGTLSLLLTVLVTVPIMYNTLRLEEKKDMELTGEKTLLKEHGKALSFFMFLFCGITAAYSVWFVALPTSVVSNIFSAQIDTIGKISSSLTGNAFLPKSFFVVFFNNLRVLTMCVLFSFLFGAGAIFYSNMECFSNSNCFRDFYKK